MIMDLLRKDYSRKDLDKKGLFKEYDYLDLLAVPCIQRQTPVLPWRSASTDLLIVNHDDEITDTDGTRVYKLASILPSIPRPRLLLLLLPSPFRILLTLILQVVSILIQNILPRSNSSNVLSFLFDTCSHKGENYIE